MDIKEAFATAVAESKTLDKKPDQETLLELYSLYKQANDGDAPDQGDYGMFDFVAKAKYDAWKRKQGQDKETAMLAYIRLVGELKAAVWRKNCYWRSKLKELA